MKPNDFFFLSLFFSSYLSVLRTTFRTKNLHPSFRTTQQFLSKTDFQSSRNLRSVIRQPWPFLKAHKNHEQYIFLNQLTYLTTPFQNFLKLTGRSFLSSGSIFYAEVHIVLLLVCLEIGCVLLYYLKVWWYVSWVQVHQHWEDYRIFDPVAFWYYFCWPLLL